MSDLDPAGNSGSAGEDDQSPSSRKVDARNRAIAQDAGLDRDLESQVPPVYGRFTTLVIAALAALAVVLLLWILI
ncbi:hypothetical protein ASE36_13675 [Rhizobium sp. Root274]|uniref:hypothetical protein n=1 Tax=unclassified Rhizobium TaxID=2613769 RepID=UPI000713623A|nr:MULTISPECIES: hypothetical protein [unclassified Rhizobium]KQW29471.1 hypothetical protein ASC71_13700 [Rhizobium sp. Root1240]KRD29661.1 hypothetical protein ASE36_13675 [Rhizobium sp. Root274]